jgi:hypothetical protein
MTIDPKPSELSSSTYHRLKLYSAAALAAGVSVLALAQPAESEVVITRKQIPIPASEYGVGTFVPISLANDGIITFSFYLYSFAYRFRDMLLWAPNTPAGNNMEMKSAPFASCLARGAKIGPSAQFSSSGGPRIEASFASTARQQLTGNWGGDPKNKYLGVRFQMDGATHYGWIRLTLNSGNNGPISATITAYAYETEANKRILAGVPDKNASAQVEKIDGPSLGMLAAGAKAVPMWRGEAIPPTEAFPTN